MADKTQKILLLAIAGGLWANVVGSNVFSHDAARIGGAAVVSQARTGAPGQYPLAQTTQIGPVQFSLSLRVGQG